MADYSEADYSEMMRDFTQFMDEIEREMYQSKEGVCLPDEIDLYNFFETWGGRAFFAFFRNFQFTPFGPRYGYDCRSLQRYLSLYNYCSQIKYYIGLNRYFSIKFKDRGTFLVSEKRYNELKAKKGK